MKLTQVNWFAFLEWYNSDIFLWGEDEVIEAGAIIEFNRKKEFKHIKPLGKGGTGDAHLFIDETTDMLFAIKKYSPKDTNFIEEHYDRFVDEIKILFNLTHSNIVRIYNYYLYPEYKLGYLQMEYIDGETIDKFSPTPWGKQWTDIFTEVISAFDYLESKNILHRDIRPANILIDKDENTKVIDFGFGKKLDTSGKDDNSIFLNWPVSQLPQETEIDGTYNHQTEIYFVGKLFQQLLATEMDKFRFRHIIEKMTKQNLSERYSSFSQISLDISKGVLGEIDFSNAEKEIYSKFAEVLCRCIVSYSNKFEAINDVNLTLGRLSDLIRNSSLENYIQDNRLLIHCFISGAYTYSTKNDIEVGIITDFYDFIQGLTPYKQKIVLDNIYTRLAKIKVIYDIDDDDLPF
jgi:eukaryotic-like serine/threonine-protein kinase